MSIDPKELGLIDALTQLKRRKNMRKVQRKIKYVLPLILALTLLLSFSQVHATTTYNWIQNSGFEGDFVNLLTDPSFESGAFSSENWTDGGSASIGAFAHYGSYGIQITSAGNNWFIQYLSNESSNSVGNITFWGKRTGSEDVAIIIQFDVVYNDTTSDIDGFTMNIDGAWHQFVFDTELDPGKFINYVKISYSSGGSARNAQMDDFIFMAGSGGGQSAVTLTSYPWFNFDSLGSDLYSNISTSFGHVSLGSYYTYSMPYGAFPLCQAINYLDSNTVSEVSLWAYSNIVNCRVKFYMAFSDGATTSQIKTMSLQDTWEKLTFTGIVLPNRIVEGIVIQILDGDGSQLTNLDDVSILSTTETGVSVFTWTLSPTPITYSNYSFQGWQRTPYLFTGFIHNATGYINGTGTYTLTSSKGTQTGVIINGVFSLTLSERVGLPDIPLLEDLRFNIVTDMSNFTVTVHAAWNYVFVEGGGGGGGGEGSGVPIEYVQFLNMLYVFIVVFAPPVGISLIVRKVKGDAMVGFIAGLALSMVAGIITGIVPVWGLFIITLVLAYSVFAKVREK